MAFDSRAIAVSVTWVSFMTLGSCGRLDKFGGTEGQDGLLQCFGSSHHLSPNSIGLKIAPGDGAGLKYLSCNLVVVLGILCCILNYPGGSSESGRGINVGNGQPTDSRTCETVDLFLNPLIMAIKHALEISPQCTKW